MSVHRYVTWLVLGLSLTACEPGRLSEPLKNATTDGLGPDAKVGGNRDLVELKQLTASFHDIRAAAAAGWDTEFTPCLTSAEGGMGFHYANLKLIDDRVDAAEPELLVYEPRADGSLRLVAVEYIVPKAQWTGTALPQLYGQEFHDFAVFGLYGLHVWLWRDNSSGTFADWNPKVSCQHAGLVH